METKVALNTAKNTVAAVPGLLGFMPENSIVTLFMTDNQVRLTARVDDTVIDEGGLQEMLFGLCAEHDFTSIIVINFGTREDEFRDIALEIDAACDDMTEDRPALIDAIQTWDDGRFVSVISPDAEVEQLTEQDRESNAVTALRVMNGDEIAASREDIERELTIGDGLAEEYIAAIPLAYGRMPKKGDQKTVNECRWANYEFAVSVFKEDEPDMKDLATLGILSTEDVKLRDAIIHYIADSDDPKTLRSHLVHVVRLLPERDALAILAMIGVASFLNGDGLRASLALDKALEIDPDYALADLMSRSIQAAMPPFVWKNLILSITAEEHLGL